VKKAELSAALEHMRVRVEGERALSKSLAALLSIRGVDRRHPENAKKALPVNTQLAKALFAAGRLTMAEFVFYCTFPIASYQERLWLDGTYDEELAPIEETLRGIEAKHGLQSTQYWPRGQSPIEHQLENKKYEEILDRKEVELFQEFAPSTLANLRRDNPKEFWNLYERGRRSVFEKTDHIASVIDLIEVYETEAHKCANSEAYYAANVMIGSAMEARILLECLRQRSRIRSSIQELPKRRRPRNDNPLNWTLENLIEVANQAGWLPNIEEDEVIHVVYGWAHRLRALRNLLHPGRHAIDRPHVKLGKEEWQDALAAYTALRHSLERSRKGKRPKT
jgi:hypothetical protein